VVVGTDGEVIGASEAAVTGACCTGGCPAGRPLSTGGWEAGMPRASGGRSFVFAIGTGADATGGGGEPDSFGTR
jgi:hypothetical protein